MLSFKDFRKETGFKCEELEEITGYSRQGLDTAFKLMNKNSKVNRRFLNILNIAVNRKIDSETEKFEKRISALNKLQEGLQDI